MAYPTLSPLYFHRDFLDEQFKERKTFAEIIRMLEDKFKLKVSYNQLKYWVTQNAQYFPNRVKPIANRPKVYVCKPIDKVEQLKNALNKNLHTIGGTNCISYKSLERKARLDTYIEFKPAQLSKAIDALVIEGRLIRKSDTMFIICAPRVEGFKTVGEVAQAIHKALEARHAA